MHASKQGNYDMDIMTGPGFCSFVDKVCELRSLDIELAQVRRDIKRCEPRCGNCSKWMASMLCPREARNNAGRRVGPSCEGVACSKFAIEAYVADRLAELVAKRDELLGKVRAAR
jgi:hypothetical protein